MNNEIKQEFYKSVKNVNQRMTKPRKAMVEILDNRHLTFKEIQEEMIKKQYLNVATMYNTLDFLLQQEVVNEVYIEGEKYYELALTNPNHDVKKHIHFVDTSTKEIKEIFAPEILKFIEYYDELRSIDIEGVKIVIEGRRKN